MVRRIRVAAPACAKRPSSGFSATSAHILQQILGFRHGGTSKWWVFVREFPMTSQLWMITMGYPHVTMESSSCVPRISWKCGERENCQLNWENEVFNGWISGWPCLQTNPFGVVLIFSDKNGVAETWICSRIWKRHRAMQHGLLSCGCHHGDRVPSDIANQVLKTSSVSSNLFQSVLTYSLLRPKNPLLQFPAFWFPGCRCFTGAVDWRSLLLSSTGVWRL